MAVAIGRAEISCSCEPDLFIDGLACCDQQTAHRLARLGLVAPPGIGRHGDLVPARLTKAGAAALGIALPGALAARLLPARTAADCGVRVRYPDKQFFDRPALEEARVKLALRTTRTAR
jgi:hypothetical protein